MRRVLALLLLLAPPAFAQSAVPEIPFDSVPDFLKLPPDMFLGEAAGVAVNKEGNVFVFSRGNTTGPAYAAAAAQLLEFSPDGRYMREIGHNLYAWSFAHSVKIDSQDNIWAADKGSDMVIKFTPKAALQWCSAASRRHPTRKPGRSSTPSRLQRRSMAGSGR